MFCYDLLIAFILSLTTHGLCAYNTASMKCLFRSTCNKCSFFKNKQTFFVGTYHLAPIYYKPQTSIASTLHIRLIRTVGCALFNRKTIKVKLFSLKLLLFYKQLLILCCFLYMIFFVFEKSAANLCA